MEKQGIQVVGPPLALYHGVPTDTVDVEAGFPAASAVEAIHVGPYDTLSQTYDEMARWAHERGLRPGTEIWEHYLTDPSAQPDTATWRTRILCPVS